MTTPLRQKLMEYLQLHRLSSRTHEMYVLAVKQLAGYCRKSPDQISDEELRAFFLYLLNDRKVSASTLTIALSGIKFCCVYTLKRQGLPLD